MSVKDRDYAWVIMVLCYLICLISCCTVAIIGVILLELETAFNASPVEINIASTAPVSIYLCSCKYQGVVAITPIHTYFHNALNCNTTVLGSSIMHTNCKGSTCSSE